MIDFHSHILPAVDDGAQDLETSLEMLKICRETGVDTIVATPHCHPVSQEKINSFLERRKKSSELLFSAVSKSAEEYPEIVLASEVRIYRGFSKLENLDKLTIDNTNYILLEMPYEEWKYDIFDEIYTVTQLGLKPIMAHLDRFLDQEHLFGELFSLGLLYQINSSAFLNKKERKDVARLFEKNAVHVVGSDTHNLINRPPNAAAAHKIIDQKFGHAYAELLDKNGRCILENREVPDIRPPKLSALKKILL